VGEWQYHAPIVVLNFGRSAAENITIAWNVRTDDRGHASHEANAFFAQHEDWHWEPMTPLPPGAGPVIPQSGSIAHWGPYLREHFLLLSRLSDGLAIYGRVRYEDLHGKRFHTDFCLYRPAGNVTYYCESHNYLK
jgi:hypothetical protein